MKFHKTLGLCLMLTVWGGVTHFAQAEGNAFKRLAAQKAAEKKQQEVAANLAAVVGGGGALGADANVQAAVGTGNVQQILAAAEAVHAAGFPPQATLDLVEGGGLAALGLQAALQNRIAEIDHNGPPANIQTAITNVEGVLGGAGTLRARADALLAQTGGADVAVGLNTEKDRIANGAPANIPAAVTAVVNAIGPGGGASLLEKEVFMKGAISNNGATANTQAAIVEVGAAIGGGNTLLQRANREKARISDRVGVPSILGRVIN